MKDQLSSLPVGQTVALVTGMLVLFGVAAGNLALLLKMRLRDKRIGRAAFLRYAPFSLVTLLCAVSMPWAAVSFTQYHPAHLLLTATFIYLGFILHFYIRSARGHKIVLWAFAAAALFFAAIKFDLRTSFPDRTWWQQMPLNVCNLVTVFIAVRPLVKSRMTDNYLVCFGIIGAFINIFLGLTYNIPFFSVKAFESIVGHLIFFSYGIYCLLKGDIQASWRSALKNVAWMIPLMVVLIVVNEFMPANHFFTGTTENPALFLYNLFPTFTVIASDGAVLQFNLIYNFVVLALALSLMTGFAKGAAVIQRKRGIVPQEETSELSEGEGESSNIDSPMDEAAATSEV
jgi:uncharacterized membrane protein YwaF